MGVADALVYGDGLSLKNNIKLLFEKILFLHFSHPVVLLPEELHHAEVEGVVQ